MARKASSVPVAPLSADGKIARLLGLFLIRNIQMSVDQVAFLRTAGFPVSEVAEMLNISENHVTSATVKGKKRAKAKAVAASKRASD